MNNYCLYHASCNDGFAAALAVWQNYGNTFEYLPVQYNCPIPSIEGNILFIVDFSFPKSMMIDLERRFNSLVMIDHHDLKDIWEPKEGNEFIYDPNHSGAVLTYQYLNPGKEVPLFFQYIEDRDLWKWQLRGSREFSAGLDLVEKDFELWDEIVENEDLLIDSVMTSGGVVLKFINQKVKSLAEKAVILKDKDELIFARVNSSLFQSEIGEYLCGRKDIDYADIYFIVDSEPRRIVHSLRSNGRANVTDIAKSFGGGGHPSQRTAGYSEILK